MYRWRITNGGTVTPSGAPVTGASLFADDLFRADLVPERLFAHLLDTARTGGVGLYPVATERLGGGAAIPTAARAGAMRSFTVRRAKYTYDFDRAQTLKLSEYLASWGDVATALDPECPFFDDRGTLVAEDNTISALPHTAFPTEIPAGPLAVLDRHRARSASRRCTRRRRCCRHTSAGP